MSMNAKIRNMTAAATLVGVAIPGPVRAVESDLEKSSVESAAIIAAQDLGQTSASTENSLQKNVDKTQNYSETVGAFIFTRSCEETRDESGVTDIVVDFYGESSVKKSSLPIIFGVEIIPVGYDGYSDPGYFVVDELSEIAFPDPQFALEPGQYEVIAGVQVPVTDSKGGYEILDQDIVTIYDCAIIEGGNNPIPDDLPSNTIISSGATVTESAHRIGNREVGVVVSNET